MAEQKGENIIEWGKRSVGVSPSPAGTSQPIT